MKIFSQDLKKSFQLRRFLFVNRIFFEVRIFEKFETLRSAAIYRLIRVNFSVSTRKS